MQTIAWNGIFENRHTYFNAFLLNLFFVNKNIIFLNFKQTVKIYI